VIKITHAEERCELVSQGLVKIPAAARFLGLCVSKVYQLMERGDLPYVKIGKSRPIPHRAMEELAAKNLVIRPEV
jgi:excisionase family DNA binding protein